MISQRIQGLILSRIDFEHPAAREKVEALASASAALGRSGDNFDDVFVEVPDAERIGEGILELADLFAQVGGDKRAFAKQGFAKVFSGGSPAQEAAGEQLFSDGLDLGIAANDLNDLLGKLLREEEV